MITSESILNMVKNIAENEVKNSTSVESRLFAQFLLNEIEKQENIQTEMLLDFFSSAKNK